MLGNSTSRSRRACDNHEAGRLWPKSRNSIQTELDSDTILVSISGVNRITSKELHEQTGAVLDQVKRGQRFQVMRGGEAEAMLVPVTDQVDPSWDEIMADVRAAREEIKSKGIQLRPNPVLEERRRRKKATLKNHAPGLR